jgi:hypothetical protein
MILCWLWLIVYCKINLFMVSLRVLFKSHKDKKFIAFTLPEVFDLLGELDSSNIVSIHIYPNYRES